MNLENLQLTELTKQEVKEINGGFFSASFYFVFVMFFGGSYNSCKPTKPCPPSPCPKKK